MRKAILTVAALGLAAGPALASAPAFAAGGGGDTVTIKNFSYSTPASVPPGATITVVNNDPTTHTVTADSGSFNDLAVAGSTTTFKAPSQPGRYSFHCNFHDNMHGVLIVGQATSSSPSSTSPSSSANPSTSPPSQMQQMPTGAVASGGGSTAGLQDKGLLLAGAASVTAGLGGLALSRRRRSTGSKP